MVQFWTTLLLKVPILPEVTFNNITLKISFIAFHFGIFPLLQFMDLRTRYTALVTLMTQYIKFAGDSLKRLEEEEVSQQMIIGEQ